MNKLAAATGVAKSTILFYVSAGLLPEPVKTSPNMAYYDPSSVDRIRLIQQMQERHRLSLSEIKQCLDDENRGSGLGVYLELNEEVFGPGGPRRLLDAKAFCRETGLSASQLEELHQARLLLPLAGGQRRLRRRPLRHLPASAPCSESSPSSPGPGVSTTSPSPR